MEKGDRRVIQVPIAELNASEPPMRYRNVIRLNQNLGLQNSLGIAVEGDLITVNGIHGIEVAGTLLRL